ncbi:MAG: cytochrome c family protein [Actinobacteria bacterium]|nr:cytochrome c family protein [Actinomycetota bacterium]
MLLVVLVGTPAAAEDGDAVDPAGFSGRCLTCHSMPYLGVVDTPLGPRDLHIDPEVYESSVHGLLPCNSCHAGFSHNPHQMVPNAEFFAETAGEACKNCHDDQFEMYKQSYHGELTREGVAEGVASPLCVDCHGTHGIAYVDTLEYRQTIADVCGACHGGREDTFLDTYHGKSLSLGREASATCVDCHGDHSILPVSNPLSTLSKANILPTCQECHPDAGEGFTTFLVHIEPTSTKAPLVVFLVAMAYLALIVAVFSFGGVHTLLYIYRGFKDKLYFNKGGGH